MRQKIFQAAAAIVALIILMFGMAGCFGEVSPPNRVAFAASYRDVPGITGGEIDTLAALKSRSTPFICIAPYGSGLFERNDGSLGGYSALFYEWLSEFFEIPLTTQACDAGEIVEKLESGEIDFAIVDLPVAHKGRWYESYPIAESGKSLVVSNRELQSIINVLNQYMVLGGVDTLYDLNRQGNLEYGQFRLKELFTEEERAYLNHLATEGHTVKVAYDDGNYPICFYNRHEEKYEGIAVEVLDEISKLSGIVFETATDGSTTWAEIMKMLKNGDAQLASEVLYSEERAEYFIWPDVPNAASYFTLISKSDYPDLVDFQVVKARVGTLKEALYIDKYNERFPNNHNLISYNSHDEMLRALESGEVDLLMGTENMLLMQRNLYEKHGYKINIRLEPLHSTFGLNKNETELCSIISKAQGFVDIEMIAERWNNREYDYSSRITQQRITYLIIIAGILAVILVVILILGSKQRKLVEELAVQKQVAQNASKSKSAFLENMSHEIRTPLTAVLGLTELVIRTAQLDEETRNNIVKVNRSGEMLLLLINDMLDISKIEAGKFELNPIKYILPSVINDTVTQSVMYIGEKSINFVLDIDGSLPHYLYGDEMRVKQIINNILSNAFKFTREGTVELGLRCEKEEDSETVWVTIWIRDTGIGIKPEAMEKLFTLYGKMEEKIDRNRRTQGTGLGLSISKQVAEMMGGSITVESEYGKGSLFTVKLRQKYVSDETIGSGVAENLKKFYYFMEKYRNEKAVRMNMSYARVLVVDDNLTNLDVAKGMLNLYGMKVDCVTRGRHAVEAVRNDKIKYNAIFMDHMMPEMDGIETLYRIRKINTEYARTVPIIALTANAVMGNDEMFLQAGFQAFISKPIDINNLDTVLRLWVRDRQAEAALPEKMINVAEKSQAERQLRYGNISGLDINRGIAHFGFNENIYMDVILSYARNTKLLLGKIEEIGVDDLMEYATIIHGIKGSSYGIFAYHVGDAAKALEMAAKSGNVDFVRENNRSFMDTTNRLIHEIENAFIKSEESVKLIKEKPEEDLLLSLIIACDTFDIDAMDAIMAKIEEWEYIADNGLVIWLREKMDQGKYRMIKDKLMTVIGK